MRANGLILAAFLVLGGGRALAHCDTLDGPVIVDARTALEKGDVTSVLKWVKEEDEKEIRAAFRRTLTVRSGGDEARELADRWFFETLVRIHRAGEGQSFTGLKPAGTDPGPAVKAADKALKTGSVEDLAREIAERAAEGVRERFLKALEARKRADHGVEEGREYVKRYVEYVHFVEQLHRIAAAGGPAHGHEDHSSR